MKWMIAVLWFSSLALAAESFDDQKGVRFKSGKEVNFEQLLIQGQLKRAEITVVTGNVNQGDDGLLRLRENFLDRIAEDIGEEVK